MNANRRVYPVFLALLALCCPVLLSVGGGISTLGLFSFPLRQLGGALRELSLSGGVGNAAAIVIYAAICLAPVIYGAVRFLRGRRALCDILLVILCGLLFWGLYLMINPAIITDTFKQLPSADSGAALIGCTVYAVLFGYIALRVLAAAKGAADSGLYAAFDTLLAVGGIVLVLAAFGMRFAGLLTALEDLKAGNTAPGQNLGLTQFFLVLHYCTDALPYTLDAFIIVRARRLVALLAENRYSEGSTMEAGALAKLCAWALGATVVCNTAFNLLQLVCGGKLLVIDSFAAFPVFSIIVMLAAMLLARLITEGKALKDDNDAFI